MAQGDLRVVTPPDGARLRVRVSASAVVRLAAASAVLRSAPPGARVLVVGASRGAADDLAREVARTRPGTFGLERASLAQLAARAAMRSLSARRVAPSSRLGVEAFAARAAFDASRQHRLGYLAPVAGMPGFPRALASTLLELRLSGVAAGALAAAAPSGADLASLLSVTDAAFEDALSVDRAALFRMAAEVVRRDPVADTLVLLDVPLDHPLERDFVAALVAGASRALATVPSGDHEALAACTAMGGTVEDEEPWQDDGDLSRLRRYLFDVGTPPSVRVADGGCQLFSAPGEGRETVEIARRMLAEARRGVAFDDMAVLVRAPESYAGLLEQALGRAGVPAYYDRGTRRPDPAGRAFLSVLACADEQLSAARFAEYLSLGQVPAGDVPVAGHAWATSQDEVLDPTGRGSEPDEDDGVADRAAEGGGTTRQSGTLQAPWRWERLLADAAVIGRDPSRWRRRLDGRREELTRQLGEVQARDGVDDPRAAALERTLAQLERLEAFAMPVIEHLASWPREATWGAWLEAFGALAPRVLRRPLSVLQVLADLRPMAAVGPVGLDEARRVLSDRLLSVEAEPPSRRAGRVFVGTPQQARGRSFRVVFVPGLAERMFPQKPREDPLLLDAARGAVSPSLSTQHRRLLAERLLLQLAVGAASERVYVSYPRIDLAEARARVPSFYALDVVRAVTGHVPDHETLEEQARDLGHATLAWPAPERPDDAIDEQEHDLAVLRRLLDDPMPARVRGHAHYLLTLNAALRRSVIARWVRGQPRWSAYDGLVGASAQTRPALDARRLAARSYSVSALQRFSVCPYQFTLGAFYRLRPLEQPEPLQRMDPLTRGSLFHEMQAAFLGRLRAEGALPITAATLPSARGALDAVMIERGARAHDALAPAVERVWESEMAGIARDLHAWLDHLVRAGDEWTPTYFEFAFGAGSVPGDRDPASIDADALVDGRFRLRGAVDLIDVHRHSGALRVTDHKTGRVPERLDRIVTGGGAVLQPVLYPLAIEASLGRPVEQGRLFYCTAAGGFAEHAIPVNERTRAAGLEVLEVIDRAIASGTLLAAPAHGSCDRCDFRVVCGPDAVRRARGKSQEVLADLSALRSRP